MVVVSDIPPNREVVQHGEQGYLIDVGDSVGFVQFTRKLFDLPELATQLGESGRQRMTTEFSIESLVQSHVRLYRELQSTRRNTSPVPGR